MTAASNAAVFVIKNNHRHRLWLLWNLKRCRQRSDFANPALDLLESSAEVVTFHGLFFSGCELCHILPANGGVVGVSVAAQHVHDRIVDVRRHTCPDAGIWVGVVEVCCLHLVDVADRICFFVILSSCISPRKGYSGNYHHNS